VTQAFDLAGITNTVGVHRPSRPWRRAGTATAYTTGFVQNGQSRFVEELMKYICLGYLEPGKFENMSESERNTVLDECFSYNDELRKNGHLVAEESLQPANTAVTVGWKDGKVAVTDGPYAETKEQLGGIQVLEARDLNHAIQLISQSPGVNLKCGTIEIRPAADIIEMMRESERRRRKDTSR
jgi:hypothetical protein